MTNLLVQEIEKKFTKKKVPVLKPGYTVKVHQKIREGEKERVQIFEGLILCLNSGLGSSKTITVRKIVEGIGVEKIFPVNSPNIVKIEVVRTAHVRRAKLYYMRELSGKSARLRSKMGLGDSAKDNAEDILEAPVEAATKEQPAETTADTTESTSK